MSDPKGQSIVNTYGKLVNERQPLDLGWSECFKYSYPIRGQGFVNKDMNGFTNALNAKRDASVLFDSTATDSIRLLASSVLSALTPPHQQWFSFAVNNALEDDLSREAKKWLEDAAETMFKNIHSSNYDSQALEFFTDEMICGMLGLYVEKKNGRYHFEVWPLASLYCQETLGDGYIDTVYRLVKFTAAEAVKKFGSKIPEAVKKEYEKDPYSSTQFEFVHTIRPRLTKSGKQDNGKIKTRLPFESIYVCKKSNMVCLESGYNEMPVIVPRWMRIPDTDYAVGPLDAALPDIKSLNKVVEFMLQNAEMSIAGMFVAKNDGVFNPNTVRIGPRRIMMVSDVNNLKPLASAGDMSAAINQIKRFQDQIRTGLLANQLGPTDKVNATATEINTRTTIIRQILGPIFGRLQAEFIVPLLTRCFGLGLRDGDFGQPPQTMTDIGFNITYRSPLALAQKHQQLEAMDAFENNILAKLQFSPEIIDIYDQDKAARKRAELLGVDIDLIKDEQSVKKARKKKLDDQAEAAVQSSAGQEVMANGVPPELAQMMGGTS